MNGTSPSRAPRDIDHVVAFRRRFRRRHAADRDRVHPRGRVQGNDLATFPDYPAEIRPAGTTAGVSGYQIQFAAHEVYSAGDQPDTLVAMNPAALKVHLPT
jgi:hypothetical protein